MRKTFTFSAIACLCLLAQPYVTQAGGAVHTGGGTFKYLLPGSAVWTGAAWKEVQAGYVWTGSAWKSIFSSGDLADVQSQFGVSQARVWLNADGTVDEETPSRTEVGDWIFEAGEVSADWTFRWDQVSGDPLALDSDTEGVDHALTSDRNVGMLNVAGSDVATAVVTITLKYRGVTVEAKNITLEADRT